MELIINQERTIEDPDEATIREELTSLGEGDFAILQEKENWYLQTLVDEDEILLEYQDGTIDAHYQATEAPQTIEDVIPVFIKYSNQDETWREDVEWELMDLEESCYTMVVACPPSDSPTDPLDCDHRIDFPQLDVVHFIELYGILAESTAEALEEEFDVAREGDVDGVGNVQWIPIPSRFHELLADVEEESLASTAAVWRDSDDFPQDDYDETEALGALATLVELAKNAMNDGLTLTAVALD